jgi:hypothetical protein
MGYGADRFTFVQADAFDFVESSAPFQFDTVLCFGLFYHTIRQVEFLTRLRWLKPRYFILDTNVRKAPYTRLRRAFESVGLRRVLPRYMFRAAYLQFIREDHRVEGSTIDPTGVVAIPTECLVEMLLENAGFQWRRIEWHDAGIDDWSHLDDYRLRKRVSYIATPASIAPPATRGRDLSSAETSGLH